MYTQLPNYVSWHTDPTARAIDAFYVYVEFSSNVSIFSPFSLIQKIMKKILEEKVQAAIIVVRY